MKTIKLALLMIVLLSTAVSAQQRRKDITKDNLKSLKGVVSAELSVAGFYLGMSFTRANAILSRSKILIGERDIANQKRIYVYERRGKRKGASLLYLIWDESVGLKRITIFEFAESFVVPAFRPLFGQRIVDVNSDAVVKSIGKFDREEVSLDISSIGLKHVTYHYCEAGFQIIRKSSEQYETTAFALVPPQSRPCSLNR